MNEMVNRSYWDRLISLETDNQTLARRLYGNGQPGDIQKIMVTLDELKGSQSRLQGAIWALGLVMPIAMLLIQHFLKI